MHALSLFMCIHEKNFFVLFVILSVLIAQTMIAQEKLAAKMGKSKKQ